MFATAAKLKLSQAAHLAPALCHALSITSFDQREESPAQPLPQSKLLVSQDLKEDVDSMSKIRQRSPRSTFAARQNKRLNLDVSDPLDDLSMGESAFLPFSSLPMTQEPLFSDLPSLDMLQPVEESSPRPFLTESAASSFLDAPSPSFSSQLSDLTHQFANQDYFHSTSPAPSFYSRNMPEKRNMSALLALDSSSSILNPNALRKLQHMHISGQTVGIDGGLTRAAKPPPPSQDDAALAVARSLVKWSEGIRVVDDQLQAAPRLHYRAKRTLRRDRPRGGILALS